MNFGMPTLLELNGLQENVELCKRLGLSFIEINCNVPEFQVDAMNPDELRRITQETGIFFSLHLDEYLSITDPNPKISEAYIQSVLESIEFAKKAQIKRLTMHMLPGVVFTLPTEKIYVYQKYNDYYRDRLKMFRDLVEAAIGSHDLKLCVENTEGFKPYMRAGVELLLESKAFGLTYDCGHIQRYDKVDLDFMQKHQKSIQHMHFHDVLGKEDHKPLGEGDIDLKHELEFASLNPIDVVIELKSIDALEKAVKVLNHYQ
jgi:sugar phosphate isomerase/epimerase